MALWDVDELLARWAALVDDLAAQLATTRIERDEARHNLLVIVERLSLPWDLSGRPAAKRDEPPADLINPAKCKECKRWFERPSGRRGWVCPRCQSARRVRNTEAQQIRERMGAPITDDELRRAQRR